MTIDGVILAATALVTLVICAAIISADLQVYGYPQTMSKAAFGVGVLCVAGLTALFWDVLMTPLSVVC